MKSLHVGLGLVKRLLSRYALRHAVQSHEK